MSETSTPAPALTDEQIDSFTRALRGSGKYTDTRRFDHWLAAVIDRAKREERAETMTYYRVVLAAREFVQHGGMDIALEEALEDVDRWERDHA